MRKVKISPLQNQILEELTEGGGGKELLTIINNLAANNLNRCAIDLNEISRSFQALIQLSMIELELSRDTRIWNSKAEKIDVKDAPRLLDLVSLIELNGKTGFFKWKRPWPQNQDLMVIRK